MFAVIVYINFHFYVLFYFILFLFFILFLDLIFYCLRGYVMLYKKISR